MDTAWLIVGLGNPGRSYERTRHNAGARAVEALATRLGTRLGRSKFRALLAETVVDGVPVKLALPTTYMNNSGQAVQALARFYKIEPDHLIVVQDEIDLPLGQLRLKKGGGTAGHHGLDSIAELLATKDFYRVRIGVGKPRSTDQTVNWVLDQLPKAAEEALSIAEAEAGDAALAIIAEGLGPAMTRYNTRSELPPA
ncbi:MAG TPA: aminoacyl-tRNA hydrolase [Actinomycetota bacterium]|nr:aminoacyl-tRNA hydrolase [Actinomycetota bacterium]